MDRLDAMTTFVKVVEVGSQSAAARALDSSLTSVSRQVAGLLRAGQNQAFSGQRCRPVGAFK